MNLEANIYKKLLKQATKAYKKGEIPVAALVMKDNKILSISYNKKEKTQDITSHAEILAIKKAAKKLKRWNLSDCILYVTLKPCSMCNEIINQSRISKVYYLLDKPEFKKEYYKTKFEVSDFSDYSVTYQQLLSNFFQNKR